MKNVWRATGCPRVSLPGLCWTRQIVTMKHLPASRRESVAPSDLAADGQELRSPSDDEPCRWSHHHLRRPTLGALSAAASETNRPIFIVGMPRSGTTLVEQNLASHSQIFGAGELTEIAEIARRLSAPPEHPPQRDEWSANARREALQYLRRLDNLNTTAFHVTDKQPDNVLHLGSYTRSSRALLLYSWHVTRAISACRITSSSSPAAIHGRTDLIDCAHRYRETAQLVEHWQQGSDAAIHNPL